MEQQDESRKRWQLREAVLEELQKFLQQRNRPDGKRWPSLDRPIALTLITTLVGGGIVGGVTTLWQTLEGRRTANTEYQRALVNTKFNLLRTFASDYQKSGNVLNSWMLHVLWLAEEKNKIKSKQDEGNIKSWMSEIVRLHEEYSKSESVDGVLAQIDAVFASPEVRVTAQTMQKKWIEFEDLMQDTNRKYNATESLTKEEVGKFEESRKGVLQDIEKLKTNLLEQLGIEIREPAR